MPGIPYRCCHCTFKSYTCGVLRAHGRLFHRILKFQLRPLKPCINSKHCIKSSKRQHQYPNAYYSKCSLDSPTTHTVKHVEKPARAKCNICHQTYVSQEKLKCHVRTMHNINHRRISKCKICGGQFSSISSLSHHMKRSHYQKDSRLKCKLCQNSYTSSNGLRLHIKTAHNNINDEPMYRCTQCSASFNVKEHLRKHYRVHGAKIFKCCSCKATFRHKSALRIHLFTHRKTEKHMCPFCSKKCRSVDELKMHLITHTQQDRKVKCKMGSCDKVFTDKRSLLIHCREIHLKMKQQKCAVCANVLKNAANLRVSTC